MERKTAQKPTPPQSTLPSSGRDALKYKTLSNQNLHVALGKKAGKEILLQDSTSKVLYLFDKTLPAVPHILSLGRKRRDNRSPPDESLHPLFKAEEFSGLQYMTLMDCGERETLDIMPGWQLEEIGDSPGSAGEKSTRTSNGDGDGKKTGFKKKIKFGDYTKFGKIVTTQASTVTAIVHPLPPKPSLAKGARGYVNCVSTAILLG